MIRIIGQQMTVLSQFGAPAMSWRERWTMAAVLADGRVVPVSWERNARIGAALNSRQNWHNGAATR